MSSVAAADQAYLETLLLQGGKRAWRVLHGALQHQDPHLWTAGEGKITSLECALDAIDEALEQTAPDEQKRLSKKIFPRLAGSVQTVEKVLLDEEISLNAWLFLNSPYQYHWFCAGVGVGKSWLLARYVLRRVLSNPETVGLVAANTHTQLAQSTLPHLFELLEQAGLEYLVNCKPPDDWGADPKFKAGYKHTISILIEPGKVAHVLTRTLTGWKRIRGTNLGWFVIDEVSDSPEGAFGEMKRRLRCPKSHKKQGLVAGIPDMPGDNWLWDEFNPENPKAKKLFKITFQASTEAKHLHKIWNSYLYPMLMTIAPLQALQEIFARIVVNQTGKVYYAYNDEVNLRDKYEYDPDRPLYLTFDFNILSDSPICAALVQVFDSGKGYYDAQVIDEIVIPNGDTAQACYELLGRQDGLYSRHRSTLHLFGDASGNHSQTISEYKVAKDVLEPVFRGRLQIPQITSNPLISDRVASVNGKLRNALGVASLFISKKCKALRNDLKKVLPKDGKIDKSNPLLTHISDALGYLLRWLFPPGELQPTQSSLNVEV
jgi:hypothetical protein